jgi:hypothetical protein
VAYHGPMALTFRDFISEAPATCTPQGHFVARVKQDAELSGVSSWPQLRDCLKASRAGRPTIKVALAVWKAYEMAGGMPEGRREII